MIKTNVWKMGVILVIPLLVFAIPAPEGLSPMAWQLLGIYLAAIIGLVIKPYPEPVVLLTAVAASAVVIETLGDGKLKFSAALSGYASGTTWLVFAAFTLSAAFVTTGLGKRIAYKLIGRIGSTTLGLGYVTVLLDLILAPATPSNTARAGGIIFPIINSIAVALGSDPEKSPCKAGRFLMINIYMVTKTTSYMFLTGFAGNALALSLMSDIFHIKISWLGWALAGGIPGLIMLAIIPYITYKISPPELKCIDNKTLSAEGLATLGPMTKREKGLMIIFLLALLGWIFSGELGIDAATVAIIVMVLALLSGVVSWDDILKNKGGWSTLIWYGGIIGLSSTLSKTGFFTWLADWFSHHFTFSGSGNYVVIILLLISIFIRYLFASGGAYVAAMVPVFATVGMVAGAPPMILALAILFSNSYGGCITHYGGAAGPIVFSAGYNDIKSWWITGTVIALLTFVVHVMIGMPWWQFLISQGFL
ncbi:Inner membrane protein ybhI [Serratia fonticola]|uniref:anion permease n=1 Tax=Serratia fonticola TaxID=47917 RepID=UPI000BFD9604|nr:anion permease [Serratia fonticola]ATM75793.1 hypothetical protein CRN79_08035 [Serratia fonticola]MBC3219625.1 anion permease [Serratia fonticola]MBC3230151.1 anion permease [Serratia fonticola]NCG54454.1 DASS family sodium-coupled anion symporter [Serratia fonticola]CAI1780614.1 Inner membrane protein ybhI [Serratia fonticola]